ncbi:hypothetical protein CR513_24044, partial [Mucuna pruriens]
MKENLKTNVFRGSIKKMVYFTISFSQEHLKRMMLLRERITEIVNTTCYLQNRTYIRSILKKAYELWKRQKLNISYFQAFGCQYFIINTKDNLEKFDPKFNNGILLE